MAAPWAGSVRRSAGVTFVPAWLLDGAPQVTDRAQLASGARATSRPGALSLLYRELGFRTFDEYPLRALGLSAREGFGAVKLQRALDSLPHVAQASREARIPARIAALLVKVATPETEQARGVECSADLVGARPASPGVRFDAALAQ